MTNASKSAVLVIEPTGEEAVGANGTPFELEGSPVAITRSHKYLGVYIQDDLNWERAREDRISAVTKATFANQIILRNQDLPVTTRLHFYRSLILPTAMWGCEVWAGDKPSCTRMQSTLATALRMILGGNSKVSSNALQWELGLAPFYLQVAKRRVDLLNRWFEVTSDTSAKWLRHLFLSLSLSLSLSL